MVGQKNWEGKSFSFMDKLFFYKYSYKYHFHSYILNFRSRVLQYGTPKMGKPKRNTFHLQDL